MDRAELEHRSSRFGLNIAALCDELRACRELQRQVEQLLDCATSVGANYRATSRSRSRKEFAAKIGVVAEEADETVLWLEFFEARQCGSPKRIAALMKEARELRNIFAASYRTSSAPKQKPKKRRTNDRDPNDDEHG